jgi:hypothetical protein
MPCSSSRMRAKKSGDRGGAGADETELARLGEGKTPRMLQFAVHGVRFLQMRHLGRGRRVKPALNGNGPTDQERV